MTEMRDNTCDQLMKACMESFIEEILRTSPDTVDKRQLVCRCYRFAFLLGVKLASIVVMAETYLKHEDKP